MEYIDVIDTAVKVGLGALISGWTTYKVTKLNHNASDAADQMKNRREILIFCTEYTDKYLSCLRICFSRLEGMLKRGIEPGPLPRNILLQYRKNQDSPLLEVRNGIVFAESRLNLIGEYEIVEKLRAVNEVENELRSKIIFEEQLFSTDELSVLKEKLYKSCKELYLSYNQAYEKTFHK